MEGLPSACIYVTVIVSISCYALWSALKEMHLPKPMRLADGKLAPKHIAENFIGLGVLWFTYVFFVSILMFPVAMAFGVSRHSDLVVSVVYAIGVGVLSLPALVYVIVR